jgi:menaquinone-dependent protoporphyrinogen oxidase
MSTRILVAYASKHGATAEIAAAIAKTMEEAGDQVDLREAEAVGDVAPYDAVVVGSAVYAGMWQKEAVRFLEAHEVALAQRPVWFFSSGPTGEGDPVELLDGWRFPEGQQDLAGRIAPREMAVFHGSIDLGKLNFGEKLIVKAVRGVVGDFRDWDAIRAWAGGVAEALATT